MRAGLLLVRRAGVMDQCFHALRRQVTPQRVTLRAANDEQVPDVAVAGFDMRQRNQRVLNACQVSARHHATPRGVVIKAR